MSRKSRYVPYTPPTGCLPVEFHTTFGGPRVTDPRPPDSYGIALQYSIKLLHRDEPLVHAAGESGSWRWKSPDPKICHLEQLRAGDIITLQENGDSQDYFVEWLRLDHGEPDWNDGQIVHSIGSWKSTVKLGPNSPREWWGELGPIIMP